MIVIHRDAKLEKCLDALKMGGGEAIQAANRAEEIIQELADRGTHSVEALQKRTKNGELRIDKCLKFDLGCAYRLICIRQKYHLFFLYAGTHDDCDRWLNNHRGLQLEQHEDLPATPLCQAGGITATPHPSEPGPETDYDEIALKDILPKDLRKIFRGLCGD
jgi:hypothetical protein